MRDKLLAENKDMRDALENKDKESSLLISDLHVFKSKLIELEKKINEDKENFDSTKTSSEKKILELSTRVRVNQILLH